MLPASAATEKLSWFSLVLYSSNSGWVLFLGQFVLFLGQFVLFLGKFVQDEALGEAPGEACAAVTEQWGGQHLFRAQCSTYKIPGWLPALT